MSTAFDPSIGNEGATPAATQTMVATLTISNRSDKANDASDATSQASPLTTFVLTKALELFVYPLGAVILVGTALALSFSRWRDLGSALFGSALIALWIAATPLFADWLNWRLTSRVLTTKFEKLPVSDAVILLGGGFNRSLHALRTYRAGKAAHIVVSGTASEAEQMADLLAELEVPRSSLILEMQSRTTRENAVNTAAVFKERGWRTGLLVTSVTHVPRAFAAFRRVGLDVVPVVTEIPPPQIASLLDFLPFASRPISANRKYKSVSS